MQAGKLRARLRRRATASSAFQSQGLRLSDGVLIAPLLATALQAGAGTARSEELASAAQGQAAAAQTLPAASLVQRTGLPPTPDAVLVLTRSQWDQSGKFALGDFLQTLPEQGDAPNLQRNNSGADYDADGATRINLRSLGVGQTLVLVDGRRVVNSGLGASAAVDLNTLPDAAVDRVEILKDGASAIYGSGAVAGVVNIVTRHGFNGSEARADFGSSSRGDAQTGEVSFLNGRSGGRASYLLSVSYFQQSPAYLGDRAWSAPARDYDYTLNSAVVSGSSRVPQGVVRIPEDFFNPGFPAAGCLANPLCNAMIGSLGWTPSRRYIRDPGAPLGWRLFNNGNYLHGDLGDYYNYAAPNYLYTPAQRAQLFLDSDIKLDGMRAYFQGFYTWRDSKQNAAPMPLNPSDYANVVVSADNLYNPFGVDLPYVGRRLVEFGPRTYEEKLGTFRLVAGLEGVFGPQGPLGGWSWDIAANYGRSSGSFDTGGAFRNSRIASAVGPSMLVAGVPRCVAVPGDASTVIAGCVPLNLFGGPGSIDRAQIGYFGFRGKTGVADSLLSLTGNLSGGLFTLPSGHPAKLDLGYEFRREAGVESADPVMAAGDSGDFNFSSTHGAQTSHEVHAELSLPLIVDTPENRLLEIDLAAAFAHYDPAGDISSFKAGFQRVSTSGWTFHASYSRSFRAPNLRELFGGVQQVSDAATDPCADLFAVTPDVAARCMATGVPFFGTGDAGLQENLHRRGDPHVKPETSDTFSVGLAYQPPRVPGLSFSVDYYRIEIADVIDTPSAATLLQRCYYPTAGDDPAACNAVVRASFTGLIQYIDGRSQNDGTLQTSGLDFGMKGAFATSVGDIGFSLTGTWIDRFDRKATGVATVDGVGNRDLGSMPSVRANAEAIWRRGAWDARIGGRYVGSIKECSSPYDPTAAQAGYCGGFNHFSRKVGSSFVVDAQTSFTLQRWAMGRTRIAVGVNNLFDRAPPIIYSAPSANSDSMLYDFVGRFAYIRLTHAFD